MHLFARRKAGENGVPEKERLFTRVHRDSMRLLFGMRQPEAAKTLITLLIALKQVCQSYQSVPAPPACRDGMCPKRILTKNQNSRHAKPGAMPIYYTHGTFL